ncbi:hypothetical protein ACA910_010730 [Epithemia clementina (nom. ined.)]
MFIWKSRTLVGRRVEAAANATEMMRSTIGKILVRKTLSRQAPYARKQFSALIQLDYEAPGIPPLTPEPKKATDAKVTTLPSGLIVVTENASSTSTVSMTYPKAGSGEEEFHGAGAAFVNKCMAFKSGSDMSTLFIYRSIEDAGGFPFASGDRYGATLGYTVPREMASSVIHTLAVDCSFEPWDVRDAKKHASIEAEEAGNSAQIVLTENLYAAAYGPQTVAGRSYYTYDVSTDALQAFRDHGYGLNGSVLAATGIPDHAAFCEEVADMLSQAPAGSPSKPSAFAYLGGESRVYAPSSGYAHVALAFEFTSSSAVANIIKHMLSIVGAQACLQGFATKGLVGVYGGTGSADASGMVDTMTTVLTTSPSPDILKRAKALAKFDSLLAIDGGSKSLAETMTATILETGSFTTPADVAKRYDAVTDNDVTKALATALKSKPSLAAVGDISMVPYHATIAARFN